MPVVDGRLKLPVAQGESVPGPIPGIGNTSSRYRVAIDNLAAERLFNRRKRRVKNGPLA